MPNFEEENVLEELHQLIKCFLLAQVVLLVGKLHTIIRTVALNDNPLNFPLHHFIEPLLIECLASVQFLLRLHAPLDHYHGFFCRHQ